MKMNATEAPVASEVNATEAARQIKDKEHERVQTKAKAAEAEAENARLEAGGGGGGGGKLRELQRAAVHKRFLPCVRSIALASP